jgi:tetratricopeptide (TPR) repeat protein
MEAIMKANTKWLAVLVLLAAIPLSGCGFISKLRARDLLNKGVKAFTSQKYDEAAQLFEQSLKLDPEFQVARIYLATAYTSQFVPGSPDPKSKEMANKGIETFQQVIDADKVNPNVNAMVSIASLYYQLGEPDKSKEWCRKIMQVYPQNSEALYRIAVIDFDQSLKKSGLQGENVTLLSEEEKSACLKDIEEGLTALDQAIKIRPDYFDAMEYQNLLLRERAKFESDQKAKSDLLRQADLIAQKSLSLRLKALEEEAKKPKKMAATK